MIESTSLGRSAKVGFEMFVFALTVLIFFGIGVLGVFIFSVILQRRMSKDQEEKGAASRGHSDSDDWGRGS